MLKDDIRRGEGSSLEFKRAVPDNQLKFLKTVVAFANCNGGRIIFGVDDDRTVVGVDEFEAFKIADGIVDAIANGCMPLVAVDSEVASVDDKTVVVIEITSGRHCPYYVKSLGRENGTFVRIGATSRQADADRVRELELAGSGRSFDSQICYGLTVVPSELKRLCATMYKVARANCEDSAERKAIKRVTPTQLEDWGVLVRSGRKLYPSYAYALLVGSRKFWAEVKCGVFRGSSRAVFSNKREYVGSVIEQIDEAYQFVMDKIDIGVKVVGVHGIPDYEIPPSAIRELIVNAIIHRSYINPLAMSVQIALFDNRLEVTVPGGLPHGMSVTMMREGHSIARNRALALACKYMRIIEAWGSGVPRIEEMLAVAKMKPLQIEDNGIDVRFVIWRKPRTAGTRILDNDSDVSMSVPTNVPVNVPTNVSEKASEQMLQLVRKNPGINRIALAKLMGVSIKTIGRYAVQLKGHIKFEGALKTGGYFEVSHLEDT